MIMIDDKHVNILGQIRKTKVQNIITSLEEFIYL